MGINFGFFQNRVNWGHLEVTPMSAVKPSSALSGPAQHFGIAKDPEVWVFIRQLTRRQNWALPKKLALKVSSHKKNDPKIVLGCPRSIEPVRAQQRGVSMAGGCDGKQLIQSPCIGHSRCLSNRHVTLEFSNFGVGGLQREQLSPCILAQLRKLVLFVVNLNGVHRHTFIKRIHLQL